MTNLSEQRMNDLYAVNTSAGWARDQLCVLLETLRYTTASPDWMRAEVARIRDGLRTVARLERERYKSKPKQVEMRCDRANQKGCDIHCSRFVVHEYRDACGELQLCEFRKIRIKCRRVTT